MPHTQPWMAALLYIPHRPSKPEHQKVPQPSLRPRQILRRIHRPQDIVTGDLPVKCGCQARKAILANSCINLVLVHPQSFADIDVTRPLGHHGCL